MGKMLVIVESEHRVAALRNQLGGDYELFVLAAPPLKVSLKADGAEKSGGKDKYSFSFALLEAGKPLLKKLREFAEGEVYLAFDRDPRGEFMSWLVAKAMEIDSPGATPPRRIHLLALHDQELQESLQQQVPIDNDMAIGYHDRAIFDISLGKHIKRLLGTQAGPGGVPLSTSCLTAILLLAEREAEIKMYEARSKQRLQVQFASGDEFVTASLVSAEGISEDGDLYYDEDIEAVQVLLRDAEFVVGDVKKTPLVIEPPLPYRLVDLLEDAFIAHRISLAKTISSVRHLFDGVDLGDGSSGLISTYAGVDVANTAMVENLRQEVVRLAGERMLHPDVAVPAGEGFLLPIRLDVDLEKLAEILDEDEYRVYAMIRDRALSSQMRPSEGESVEVEITAGDECVFRATGNDITKPGYQAFFPSLRSEDLPVPSPLGRLQQGSSLPVGEVKIEPVERAMASFYTIESLFADLADFSIEPGPVSVNMMHRLVAAGYVEILADGSLRCLGNLNKVTATLGRAFPTMQGVNLTAYLEQTISEVLSGRKALDFALRQFDQTMFMKGKVIHKTSLAEQMQSRLRNRKPRGVIKSGGAAAPAKSRPKAASSPKVEPSQSPAAEVEPVADVPVGKDLEPEVVVEQAQVPEPLGEEGVVVAPPDDAEVAVAAGEKPEPEVVAETPSPEAGEEESVPVEVVGDDVEANIEAEEGDLVAVEPVLPEEPAVTTIQDAPEEISSVDLALDGVAEPMGAVSEQVSAEVAREEAKIFDEPVVAPPPEPAIPPVSSVKSQGEKTGGMECPVCGKARILTKETPTGKAFYVCPREECEFMAWATPHALPCQVCDSLFLVEKKDLHGHTFLRCPKAGCNFRQPVPGDDGAALLSEERESPPSPPKKKKVLVRRAAGSGSATGGKKKKVLVRRRK